MQHLQGKPLLNWKHALQASHYQEAQRRRTPEEKQRMVPACAPQPHTEPHALEHQRELLQGNSCTNVQECATISKRDSRGSARRRVALAPPRAAAAGSPWSPARAAAHQHTLLCHPRRRYAYASEPGARQHLPKPQPGASRVQRGAVSIPAHARQAELHKTGLQQLSTECSAAAAMCIQQDYKSRPQHPSVRPRALLVLHETLPETVLCTSHSKRLCYGHAAHAPLKRLCIKPFWRVRQPSTV